jgi:hypothetical protein
MRRTIAMLDASGVCQREPAGEDRNGGVIECAARKIHNASDD